MQKQIKQIKVKQLPIRLGQFLKMADLVQDGIEAKIRIKSGEVQLNGATETRRGKQLKVGDIIDFAGQSLLVSVENP